MARRLARNIGMVLAAPLSLAAQGTTLAIEVGSARMRFADSIDATTVSVAPAVRVVAPRGSFIASGTFSQLRGASSNSGVLDGTWSALARGRWTGEIEGVAGGSAHSDGTRTGQLLGLTRLHVAATSRGAWLGGGMGRTWDGAWRGVLQGDVGGWLVNGASSLTVSLSPTVVDDTIKYSDTFIAGHRESSRWELDASLGIRAGNQLPTLPANRSTWGSVGATWWATPRFGVVASAGTYPVDFTQGFPGGQFVSLSVRLRSPVIVWRPPLAEATATPADRVSSIEARRVSGGSDQHRIRVFAPGARNVELSGDFTLWTPVALTSEGRGWWTATLPISRGTHEVNVRVNGGPWRAPPGLAALDDEFGGTVGLLVIR
jgi:hypothetical protein